MAGQVVIKTFQANPPPPTMLLQRGVNDPILLAAINLPFRISPFSCAWERISGCSLPPLGNTPAVAELR